MRIVQTLVVRDEDDVVDAQIAYHLNAGVNFVIATDHESHDGTTGILEEYERAGYLHLIRERGEMRESAWRTRMARLAATDFGADWVINTDADEFWMPRRGTLKQVFAAVPERFGVVWGLTRPFVPRPENEEFFAERMTVRLSSPAAINDPTSPYRPHSKAAHRADPEIGVGFGSHKVFTERLAPIRDWYPADVLHFPFRSLEQYERKTVRRARGDKPLGQYVRGLQARDAGRIGDAYQSLLVDDTALERGLADGLLTVDTRLRDALLELSADSAVAESRRSPTRQFLLPSAGTARACFAGDGDTAEELRVVAEGVALRDADIVRLFRSIDLLGLRVSDIEERAWVRAARALAARSRGQARAGL